MKKVSIPRNPDDVKEHFITMPVNAQLLRKGGKVKSKRISRSNVNTNKLNNKVIVNVNTKSRRRSTRVSSKPSNHYLPPPTIVHNTPDLSGMFKSLLQGFNSDYQTPKPNPVATQPPQPYSDLEERNRTNQFWVAAEERRRKNADDREKAYKKSNPHSPPKEDDNKALLRHWNSQPGNDLLNERRPSDSSEKSLDEHKNSLSRALQGLSDVKLKKTPAQDTNDKIKNTLHGLINDTRKSLIPIYNQKPLAPPPHVPQIPKVLDEIRTYKPRGETQQEKDEIRLRQEEEKIASKLYFRSKTGAIWKNTLANQTKNKNLD